MNITDINSDSDSKFTALIKILDNIRDQVPKTPKYSRFYSKKSDDVVYSRGQAFIHLLLWIKFGVDTFEERNNLITDGPHDGGLDAYYISQSEKIVYLVQAKFKSNKNSFAKDSIDTSDLVKMELDRILRGKKEDTNGTSYNSKVLDFQSNHDDATKKNYHSVKVVFLANLNNYNDIQIRKLTNNLDYEIYDYKRCYLELVKPVCSGTYYNPDKILIELDVSDKPSPQLRQTIKTSHGDCDVTVLFVPTSEIARVMSKYKNSILRYNPRNYLGLTKNIVNKDIRASVLAKDHNDFALLNNGITILADAQAFTTYSGRENTGKLELTNPQIINGGQTAYTLSEIYESKDKNSNEVFKEKEVLLRVIVLKPNPYSVQDNNAFIQSISSSTNMQTQIKNADRNSSITQFINMQEEIYLKYGYFLELKSGEFFNGLNKKIIDKRYIINRTVLLRCLIALLGKPGFARGASESDLYENTAMGNLFKSYGSKDIPNLASSVFYAYQIHLYLSSLTKGPNKRSLEFGYSLRYGKYAVIYAVFINMGIDLNSKLQNITTSEIKKHARENADGILCRWKLFETGIKKYKSNNVYFDPSKGLMDYDSYYKGSTNAKDILQYFSKKYSN